MSIDIVSQYRAKPGHSAELLRLVMELMPSVQRPEGCFDVSVRRNQDDASELIVEQRWQSRQQAERWRANPATLTAIRALVAEPVQVRFFERVDRSCGPARLIGAGAPPARTPAEVPKISTPEALGG